jgi:predicted ATPase
MSLYLESVTLHPEKYPAKEFYPFSLEIFNQTKTLTFDTRVTLFAGENGTGKSTLLKSICRACNIHIWQPQERTRYDVNKYEDSLPDYLDIKWANGPVPGSFFGSDIFKYFAQLVDEWAALTPDQLNYFGGKSLITQSHGQSLMSYFRNRYKIKGLYLMDEPETALSPKTQLELLDIINKTSKEGHAQFIIATHSPILLSCTDAKIYSFDSIPVKQVEYEETEHYKVYKDFFESRKTFEKI